MSSIRAVLPLLLLVSVDVKAVGWLVLGDRLTAQSRRRLLRRQLVARQALEDRPAGFRVDNRRSGRSGCPGICARYFNGDRRTVGEIESPKKRFDAIPDGGIGNPELALELTQVPPRAEERLEERVLLAVEPGETPHGELALDRRATRVAVQPSHHQLAVAHRAIGDD